VEYLKKHGREQAGLPNKILRNVMPLYPFRERIKCKRS
jgi:hypothetical protein